MIPKKIVHQYPLVALLTGPDSRYKDLLLRNTEQLQASVNNDKHSFFQVYVRKFEWQRIKFTVVGYFQGSLNAKQQKRLLKHQRQDKSLCFTFPISYSCPIALQKPSTSLISSPSLHSSISRQVSNSTSRLKSAVSISFVDENTINSSFLHRPSFTQIRSSNACESCHPSLSNGICSCIVQSLLQLNSKKKANILVELNDIFENLTSNNIIT
ncbi:unnamed protein product [Adineta ricciae]|uniref:Uncharacterized protein n=1 Tax=Adineta ricciae TaxID=249248 RepID=A0A814ZS75_ADIRI|nr:unnamed protein product [Adineta ricciae]